MAEDMTLLWGSGSPMCWRVMIVLEEKNLQGYNNELFSFEKMEHKSEKVMAMNPRGQLPAFKHGDYILNESHAACLYLENQFKSQGNELIPDCPEELARMYQRMFEASALFQKLGDHIYYEWKVPERERHDSAVKRNRQAVIEELKLWEGYLEKGPGPFISGQAFSLSDVSIFPLIANAFYFGLRADRYPKLAAYYNQLKDRPSIKSTWPPHWKGAQAEDRLKDL
ncbi:glutathione S-transferase A-like [Dunckerocampus dactyliophorus]|uniref:glutathione S-transferase A-like n=1 Tax=Dunckerocampus dactyliophorus TaxID=161453 RepID=UPI002405B1B2|nr:glutathione S-transferase A-like [Dunckerocampus dactyliophorus]